MSHGIFQIFSSSTPKDNRYTLDKVKGNDLIMIEWNRIQGGIGPIKCINNDPKTKKILLQMRWRDGTLDTPIIKDYSDSMFKNFHLLNSNFEKDSIEKTIDTINSHVKQLLIDEKYEDITKLKMSISNIFKEE